MSWLLLAGAIVAEVAATLSLRASDGLRKRRWLIPVATLYPIAFALLFLALAQGVPVGIAYGIWAAVGTAATAVLARVLFRDRLTWTMAAGILFIGAGVVLIELGAAH